MQLFKEADLIIHTVEDHLTSLARTNWTVFSLLFRSVQLVSGNYKETIFSDNFLARFFLRLCRIVWLPPKFLTIGITEIMSGTHIWAILVFVQWGAGSWLARSAGIDVPQAQMDTFLLLTSSIVAFILTAFALPSVYANNGITNETVLFVANYLERRGFKSAPEIDLLKKTIKPFDESCRSRITVLKSIVGLMWAGLVYVITQCFTQAMAHKAEVFELLPIVPVLIPCIFVLTILVWGYEAAIDKLFRAIEYGCNDFCYAREKEKQKMVEIGEIT